MKNYLVRLFKKSILKQGYPSFWFLNAIGWIAVILADVFVNKAEVLLGNWHRFIENSLQVSMGFIITIGLRAIYKNFQYRKKSLLQIIGYVLLFSFIASLLFFVTAHVIFLLPREADFQEYLTLIKDEPIKYVALQVRSVFPIMTSWSLLYFGIKFWLDWSNERDRAEKLDLLAQSAQLQMLRYQVNPHFLFNSFSSLRALIRTNQIRAEEMVSKLSEFYRYSLTVKNNTEVPLVEEIEAVEHFFEIEKIRFGDKLEYYIKIEPLAEEYPVPCFMIHPLIENAVKYGMKTSDLPLVIKN